MEELLEKKEEPDKKKDRVLVVIIIVLAAALAVIKIVEFIADGEFQQTDATNENVIIQWRGKTVEEPYIIEVSKNKQDGYWKVDHIYVDTRNHNICSTYIHDLKPGSSYYVRIYSVDSSGKKKYSEPLEVVTEPEGKIENLKYEWKKSNSVKLSWDKVSGANVYKVRYYKDNDEYIKYTTKNSLTLKNLKKGEGYSTRVEPMRQSESGFHVESNNAGEGKIYIE